MSGGQEYSLNLGLDVLPISTDKDNLPDLNRLYNAVKGVARGLDTYTNTLSPQEDEWQAIGFGYNRVRNLTRSYVIAGEDLAAGTFVEFYADSGTLKARLVNPGVSTVAPRPPNGFIQTAVAAGDVAEVFLSGLLTNVSGLTLGAHYWYYWQTTGGSLFHHGIIAVTADIDPAQPAYYLGQAVTTSALYCQALTRVSSLVS